MSIALTSIGAKVSYAMESTAGTRPTENYAKIPKVTEIPEMNPTPDLLDTTSLDNLQYTSGIAGLKTLDVLAFVARFSQELFDLYEADGGIIALYNDGKESGLGMWICIDIDGLNKSCYIPVEPSPLGMPAVSTNSVIDVSLYFTPVGEPVWAEDPTYAT